MTLDINKLEAAAKAATQGEWFSKRDGFSTIYIEARIGGGWLQEVAACGPTANGSIEQEANATHIATANPQAVQELLSRLRGAEASLASVIQQAQIWKMEALTNRSTVHECYQACTGATGEPGDWHGANPIKELKAKLEAAEHDAAKYFWLCEKHAEGDEQWFVYGAKTRDMDSEIVEAMKESA